MSKIVITSEHKFRRAVTAKRPADGGPGSSGYDELTFNVTYRCLPSAKLDELKEDKEIMAAVAVEIEEMEVDGTTLAGEALKAALAEITYMRSAIVRAYIQAMNGARAGN